MSHLISRILLAILLFPLASLFYLVVYVVSWRSRFALFVERQYFDDFIFAGAATWLFVGFYWYFLWRGSVRLTQGRFAFTLIAAVVSAIAGLLIGVLLSASERDVGSFVGSTAAPLLWLVATCFIWRESAEERGARLASTGGESVICPACGYNLTGLSNPRCPECGKQYTLDELLAGQPSRVSGELQTSD